MKQLILMFALLLGVMGVVAWLNKSDQGSSVGRFLGRERQPMVVVGKSKIGVELADTALKRQKGLSGRENLESGKGMLFKFPADSQVAFWMKEMKFAIDIIWINDERIVKIEEDVLPPKEGEELKLYESPGGIDFVLEVPAGYANSQGIKVDDKVSFENI